MNDPFIYRVKLIAYCVFPIALLLGIYIYHTFIR